MAELEQAENGDEIKAREWLARATTAVHDPIWLCGRCGFEPKEWDAHCPDCHRFDTISFQPKHYAVLARAS
jgi:HemY protein